MRKAKRYYAAEGGEVPDEEDDDETIDDGKDEDATKSTESPEESEISDNDIAPTKEEDLKDLSQDEISPQGAIAKPIPTAQRVADKNAADDAKAEEVKAYLASQFAKANDNSAILEAQKQQKSTNNISNIAEALEGLARSNSMAHGGQGVDSGFYKGMREQGAQGVNNAIANRQNAINAFLQNNEMNRQVAQDMMTKGDYQQKTLASAYLNDRNDPSSQVSKNAVEAAQGTFKDYPDIQSIIKPGMSAQEVQDALGGVEKKSSMDAAKQMKTMQMQYQQDQIKNKKEAVDKASAVKDFASLGKDLDSDLASSRTSLGQANSKIIGAQRVMTFADVTPEELAAAKTNPQVANQLIQKLNKLTPQQYTEVVSGLMSQITPGSGSLGQLEHLRANTADQQMANIKQYLSSSPSAANMGPLLLNNLMTLKNEQDTGKTTIDAHTAQMQAKHPLAFKHEDTADMAKNLLAKYSAGGAGGQTVGSLGQPGAPAPHGNTVVQNGVTFSWDGSKYVPQEAVGAK